MLSIAFLTNLVCAWHGILLMLIGFARDIDMFLAVVNAAMSVYLADEFDYLVSTLALRSRRIF